MKLARRAILIFGVFVGSAVDVAASLTFTDVTDVVLPDLAIAPGQDSLVPVFTGGAAIGDCDGDGDVDVYFTGAEHDVLYRNLGNGTFEDATIAANLGYRQGTRGAAFGDVDNDGDLDLYATGFARSRHYLYINAGACVFTEQADERGVDVDTAALGRSPSFGDYDRDGYLDLYVAEQQSDVINPGVPPPVGHLFRNRGLVQPGYFDDLTVAAGVAVDGVVGSQSGTFPFLGRFSDLDDDGWPDLVMVADFEESRLFWNDGAGGFVDGTVAAGVGTDEHGMGATTADVDGDGLLDIYVTSIFLDGHPRATGNRLYLNQGNRTFLDATEDAGVRDSGWGWGTQAFDYDNDGDLDLIAANGINNDEGTLFYLEADLGPVDPTPFFTDPLRLWRNDGSSFSEESTSTGLVDTDVSQGILTFDYDRDGDLDVLITYDPNTPKLFRNDGGSDNHWIAVEIDGRCASSQGVGARVTVTPAGGAPMLQELSASSTYLAQDGTGRAHFGLGPGPVAVASVRVEWPSGATQTVPGPPIDAVLTVTEAPDCRREQLQAQQGCILALNKAAARLTAAVGRRLVRCVRATAAGTALPSTCLASDRGGRIAAAQLRTESIGASVCTIPPSFGARDAAAVNAAALGVLRVQDVFGPDLDATLQETSVDPAMAACQLAVAKGLAKLAKAKVQAFNDCKRAGLVAGTIASAADLRTCHVAMEGPAVAAQVARLERRVVRKCSSVPIDQALPGDCAAASAATLASCVDAEASCGSCRALDSADGLTGSCHRFSDGVATSFCGTQPTHEHSIAQTWDEALLAAIRRDTPRPTVHARNLFHLSALMWDAWRAYGGGGTGWLTDESHVSDDPARDRAIAISFAAYRLLAERFRNGPGQATTQAALRSLMDGLGFDVQYTTTVGDTPAAVGNRMAAAMLAFGLTDGSNEAENYTDSTYAPVNAPLVVTHPGTLMVDPNRWQPLALDLIISQNGIPLPNRVQTIIGAHWNDVTPFALTGGGPGVPYIDPGPPPQLGGVGDAEYKEGARQVLELSSQLDPSDGVLIDVSPGAFGNNPLGTNDGTGHPLNPVTGQPYAPNVVLRGDFLRVLAEFWADGPASETPPGHWNVIANEVSHQLTSLRIGGTGPEVDRLEWDVKLYFALNGAVHDAAIVAWGLKREYDSVRPISMIRHMAGRGQSSDPVGPSYAPDGLPLQPGLIEVITAATTAPGERHAHLAGHEGEIAVYAYPGPPANATMGPVGAHWIRGVEWTTYQRRTFVSPAFPGYTSGHSTFSRAAAEVMTAFTGSPFVPGGLAEFRAEANTYLLNERGPSTDIVLQWASYHDAADQAGSSRPAGGIHVYPDDFLGRIAGAQVGQQAFTRALQYW